MQAVAQIEKAKAQYAIPYIRMVRPAGLKYASFMRWKRRIAAGDPPLQTPGPKKIEPLDLADLTGKIEKLSHGRKRTRDTGRLHESYKDVISRRELNAMIISVRRDHNRNRAAAMNRVIWHRPDVGWALDGTVYKAGFAADNQHVQTLQDLCSCYKFPALTSGQVPCGEEIAGHLDRHFGRFGPPLFLKRDNAGNLNHPTVNQVLEEAMVIPINSPVYKAAYNGAVEHAQGEVKAYLRIWDFKATSAGEFALLTEAACHDLNHHPRRCMGNRSSCRVYFGKRRVRYSRRQRRAVYDWIRDLAVDISQRAGLNEISLLAWRVAAKIWLEKNRLITILKPGKVLPNSSLNFCHN
jgi:hypothetical protein